MDNLVNAAVRLLIWRMSSEEPISEDGEHEHCRNCVKRHCPRAPPGPTTSTSSPICHMITCELKCGFRFHACKLVEHLETCMEQRVACINHCNGCPITLPRKFLGKHLEVCPASVMHCTMEWNRWPVYSKERQSRVPFVQDNFHAVYGQLDVALALRDQRMLNEALKAPRSTRRALRNSLTQRFPAVPLQKKHTMCAREFLPKSEETSQTMSDDDSDAPWNVAKEPPGLKTSVLNELFRATKRTTDSLTAALSVVTDNSRAQQNEEPERAEDIGACAPTPPNQQPISETLEMKPYEDSLPESLLVNNGHEKEDVPNTSDETSLYHSAQERGPGTSAGNVDTKVTVEGQPHSTGEINQDDGEKTSKFGNGFQEKIDPTFSGNETETSCASFSVSNGHAAISEQLTNGTVQEGDIDVEDDKVIADCDNIVDDKVPLQLGDSSDDDSKLISNLKKGVGHGGEADEKQPESETDKKRIRNRDDFIKLKIRLTSDTDDMDAKLSFSVDDKKKSPLVGDPAKESPLLGDSSRKEGPLVEGSSKEESPLVGNSVVESSPATQKSDQPVISRLPQVISGDGVGSYLEPPPLPPPLTLKEILALDINLESITRYQAKPKSMYTFLCAQEFRRDEYLWHFKNVHNDIHGNLNGWLEQRCPLAHYGCTHSLRRLYPMHRGAQVVYNKILDSFGVVPKPFRKTQCDNAPDDQTTKISQSTIPPRRSKESTPEIFTSKDYNSAVQVNGNMSRLLAKSKVANSSDAEHAPCTSLAKQEKELANIERTRSAHGTNALNKLDAKNNIVNGESPNNFLSENAKEELSCEKMNSVNGHENRVTDENSCDKISEHVSGEVFGNTSSSECNKEKTHLQDSMAIHESDGVSDQWQASFSDLPFEVLQHIGRFLDAYSLCNLALTNQILRQVCCTLLEEKGIVIQEWERETVNGKHHWHIGYKRWLFSTAFSPVRNWGFEDQVHMSEHLKTCHFYHTISKTNPVLLPGMEPECVHSDEFWPTLLRMYPDYEKPKEEEQTAKVDISAPKIERAEHGSEVLTVDWHHPRDYFC